MSVNANNAIFLSVPLQYINKRKGCPKVSRAVHYNTRDVRTDSEPALGRQWIPPTISKVLINIKCSEHSWVLELWTKSPITVKTQSLLVT